MEYSRDKIYKNRVSAYISIVKTLLISCMLFLTVACSSLRSIEIESAISPEYPIADDIQSLGLLNRSLNLKFSNLDSDSLEHILIDHKMQLDTIFRDIIASDTLIHVVANTLFNSGRFDVVIPFAYNVERNDYGDIDHTMDIETVNSLCKDYQVNGLLILEGFREQLVTKYEMKPFEPSNMEIYSAITDLKYFSEWRLYRSGSSKPAIRFQISDSIFWKANSNTLNDLYTQMPHTKEALIGGGVAAAIKMAHYISPNFVLNKRFYFLTGRKDIDLAVPLIKLNKWEDATAIWTKFTNEKSLRIRSRIEFNLALASEMTGNLDLAIDWGLKSYKTFYTSTVDEYLKKLDRNRKIKQKESTQRY